MAEALSKVEEVLAEHAPRKHLSTPMPEANVRHINLMVESASNLRMAPHKSSQKFKNC